MSLTQFIDGSICYAGLPPGTNTTTPPTTAPAFPTTAVSCNTACATTTTTPGINFSGLVQFGNTLTCLCLLNFIPTPAAQGACTSCTTHDTNGTLVTGFASCGSGNPSNGAISVIAGLPVASFSTSTLSVDTTSSTSTTTSTASTVSTTTTGLPQFNDGSTCYTGFTPSPTTSLTALTGNSTTPAITASTCNQICTESTTAGINYSGLVKFGNTIECLCLIDYTADVSVNGGCRSCSVRVNGTRVTGFANCGVGSSATGEVKEFAGLPVVHGSTSTTSSVSSTTTDTSSTFMVRATVSVNSAVMHGMRMGVILTIAMVLVL
ncbi:hypothetical protein HDU98_007002 [Podochytrium sp. JEL0797]|nr:hypothetical protein HDU98_007002 [Podochytrium sp. JEL0797]